MEALLFFFTTCHCSWQESAQSGRRLSWAENRKELRKRERTERKNTAALFWLVFQDTRLETPQPTTRWVLLLPFCTAATSGGAIFMPSSAGAERLSPCRALPEPSVLPLHFLHVIHPEPLWLHSALHCVLRNGKCFS